MRLFLLMIACGGAPKEDSDVDAAEDTAVTDTAGAQGTDTGHGPVDACDASWDPWASGFFSTYCRSCHSETSATRYGAPSGVDFDDREDVQMWSERVRARVLVDQTMPLGGGVTEEVLARLDEWLGCLEAQR